MSRFPKQIRLLHKSIDVARGVYVTPVQGVVLANLGTHMLLVFELAQEVGPPTI